MKVGQSSLRIQTCHHFFVVGNLLLVITAVMAKRLEGQTAVLTALVRAPHECRFSVQCKVIALYHFL